MKIMESGGGDVKIYGVRGGGVGPFACVRLVVPQSRKRELPPLPSRPGLHASGGSRSPERERERERESFIRNNSP